MNGILLYISSSECNRNTQLSKQNAQKYGLTIDSIELKVNAGFSLCQTQPSTLQSLLGNHANEILDVMHSQIRLIASQINHAIN